MPKPIIIKPANVKAYHCSNIYDSKMLLDNTNSDSDKIHINRGTLKAGGALLPASKHGEEGDGFDEVYIVVKGACLLELDGEVKEIQEGDIIYIPSGVFHGLDNKMGKEDLELLTIWNGVPPKGINEAYDQRINDWGKSYVLIDKEFREK